MNTLKIENLYASVEDKQILKGISLEVKENEMKEPFVGIM